MEEKKNVINMNAATSSKGKMNYEELNDAFMKQSQEIQQMQKYIKSLHQQITEMGMALQIRRLEYLFKVIELRAFFKDAEFIDNCIKEVKEALTEPKEESKDN